MTWSAGQLGEALIRADRNGTVQLRGRVFTVGHTVVDVADGTSPPLVRVEADSIRLTVSAGRTYRVQPTGQPSGSLEQYFSNAGTTNDDNTGIGDFDGGGATLSAQALAQVAVTPGATVSRDGVNFRWPNVQPGGFDNAMAAGQSIAVSGTGSKLGFLATGTYGTVAGTATVVYADGTRQSFTLSVPDWYGGPKPGATAAIVRRTRTGPATAGRTWPRPLLRQRGAVGETRRARRTAQHQRTPGDRGSDDAHLRHGARL